MILDASVKLGRYETLVRLGRGGMAEVFAARLSGEAGFAKLVAVKRMLAHLSSDAALVARFHDEARLAALVASPHVVQTLDVGNSEDGQPFIVLELVLGVSLAQLLAQKPLPSLPVRLELVTQAALGLADVHEAIAPDGTPLEIVHRDVSPHNILVGSDGRARLADFGIARANVPREETRTGVVLGKWGYMSPEQIRCGPLDARTDVYAMGAVVWEALTGRRLHGGSTPAQITQRILSGALPSAVDAAPALPPALVRVVERALAKEPADRFANGRELAEELRDAARELGPPVTRKTLVEEVRRAAGRSLSDLEAVLAELDDTNDQRTATLSLDGATTSGLLGDGCDPSAATSSLAPAEATLPDDFAAMAETIVVRSALPPEGHTGFTPTDRTAIDRRQARAPERRSLRAVHFVALAIATLAIGATVAGVVASLRDPPPQPIFEPRPVPRVLLSPEPAPPPVIEPPRPVEETSIESPTTTIERPRNRPVRPRPIEPADPVPRGPLLGTERFDEAQR